MRIFEILMIVVCVAVVVGVIKAYSKQKTDL